MAPGSFEEDLLSALTRQVREDAVQTYLTERRLVVLEIEGFWERFEEARMRADDAGLRVTRIARYTMSAGMLARLVRVLGIPSHSYWTDFLGRPFSPKVRFIRVRALTTRARFRKLLLEAYRRLHARMESYSVALSDLVAECRAVNLNIAAFHKNHDILAVTAFLREMDRLSVEHTRILGENFTASEIAAVGDTMAFRPLPCTALELPPALSLPDPEDIEGALEDLANDVYRAHGHQVQQMVR